MSSFLYALGRAAFRHKWRTAGIWLLVVAVLGGSAGLVGGSFDNEFSIPGARSQVALDQLGRTFPEVSGTSASLIVVAPEGSDVRSEEVRDAIETGIDELEALDFVDTASSPYDEMVSGMISDDDRAAIVSARIPGDAEEVTDAQREELVAVATDLQESLPGSQASMGGEIFNQSVPGFSIVEVIGVGVALVVLLITLGSVVAAGMPLLTALLGVGVSMTLLLLATGFTTISSTTPMLSVMLGLAVGIDYALFILSRHREQLARGLDVEESAARSVATAGSAVVFAGLTVIIALVGLAIAQIPFLTAMGVFAAIGVAVAVVVALTMLPALMGMAGERMRPKKVRRAMAAQEPLPQAAADRPGGFFAGWVKVVTKVPAVTVVVVLVGSVLLSLPARDLTLALPNAGENHVGTPARTTYDLQAEYFGPGFNGPLIVTAEIVGSDDPLGVMEGLQEDIEAMPGVASVPLATPNQNADTGFVQIVPTTGPSDPATADLVERLREMEPGWQDEYDVTTAVTGVTAIQIDVSDRLAGALLPFGIFVVGLSLVLLTMVFRSIAVPIKATLGYLLSIGVAFGLTTLVFIQGHGAELINLERPGPIISFLPILLMGILFGLAMDYEVFLVSRMREDHVHGTPARAAVHSGFRGSASVVTAAAVIMFAVFAFFVPEGEGAIKPIAFALAVGVAFDAFVVRMTLVPAVMALLGERAWWLPGWLEKRLPALDVEGEQLHRELALAQWPAAGAGRAVHAEGLGVEGLVAPVDLDLDPGQVLVVEGAPSGRAALMMSLSGRMTPDLGQARVVGQLVPGSSAALRRRTGYVDATVHAQVARGLEGLARRRPPLALVDGADALATPEARQALDRLLRAAQERGDQAVVLGVTTASVVADLVAGPHQLLVLRPPAAPGGHLPEHAFAGTTSEKGLR
ncbi:MMPL family transporter [Auraticoccus monumenti]|uniref:Putative drug exporter of the RND superfamily n=1 Tax=Auraticoccus monumenti TaxID=675864 RepID=A0A1G6T0I4_9ACTN|nr:MMPL family transporter [Auraticoccus monumenti]SDD22690.1 putative drug exporter of the RND superfamily [Auraticoccus monumenti]